MSEQTAPQPSPRRPALIENITEDSGRLTGASTARLAVILTMLLLVTEVVPLQIQMATIIIPKIGLAFPAAGSNVSWTVTIAGIAGGATMALAGKAGDVFGKKRVLVVLGLLCAVGALLSAIAPNWAVFLTGRGISAVSLGMAVVNLGLVRDLMPRHWIPIAVGFVGTGFAFSGIIGPLVSGVLTDHFSWRSVYWFLLIYSLVVTPLFALFVPESPVRVRQRFDVMGALLFGAGIALVSVYLSEGGSWGWGNAGALGCLIGGLVALAAFAGWELRAGHPMLDLTLIRRPAVYLVILAAFFVTGLQSVLSIMLSYLFETPHQAQLEQQVLAGAAAKAHVSAAVVAHFATFKGSVSGAGFSVLQLAYHITIWQAIFSVLFAPLGGWLCRRIGARVPLIISGVALTAACALWISWHSTWQEQVGIGVLLGLGSGFFFAAWPNLIMDAVPAGLQGISAGMVQVFGGIGTSVAAALIASILAAHPFQVAFSAPGQPTLTQAIPQVYTDAGFSQAYLLLGVIPAAIAIIIGVVLRTGRTPARGGAPAEVPEAVPAQARP
ncbi:MAG: MFS transporter [Trebonia sp.]